MIRLDRYVGRTLLGSWIACLFGLMVLFVLVDLLLNMPGYIDRAGQQGIGLVHLLGAWLRYHVVFAPFVFVTIAPFVTVIGAMFAVSRLMMQNELMPMLFCGRSMFRVLTPALLLGLGVGLTMAAAWQFVIPRLSESIASLRSVIDPGETLGTLDHVVARAPNDPRRMVLARSYLHERLRMEGVFVLDKGSRADDQALIEARAADWNPELRRWELTGGVERRGTTSRSVATLQIPGLTPDLLWRSGQQGKQATELSYTEIQDLRELRPGRHDYVIAFHQHLTFPLANVVLLLLALPFAVSFERGGRVGRVLLAILICGGYLVVDLTCQNLGRREYLHPIVAAWVPTIVFGSVGIVIYGGMRT